jgi:hypothetical protein
MKTSALVHLPAVYLLGALCVMNGALAQAPAAPTQSQTRPDATYPNPSGQDSQPKPANPRAAGSKQAAPKPGTVESRSPTTSSQSPPARSVAKQKQYQGNTGKKADPGTACSTARPTRNGGVDCGTGGQGATPGKVPK